MQRPMFRVLLLSALVALLAVPVFAVGPLQTELGIDDPFLTSDHDVELTFTLTNTSHRPMKVLRWNLPFDGIEGNIFEVAHDGEPVPYLGRVYKRGTPTADDYLTLAPGESRTTKVELSSVYAMRYTGEYVVRFRGQELGHTHREKARGAELIDLGSNYLALWMDGEEAPLYPEFETKKGKPGSDPSGCSNSQLSTLANALAAAQGIAADSFAYLSGGHNANSLRYTEWFGTYSSGRWNTVESNFQAISDALDNAPVEFDCSCRQRYYAYVYPNQPYKIYLCKAFWSAPMTGTDSKAGTLVHEMSHFNVVAGTDDVTYGQSSCRALADSNPNQAIQNADSHEYFAENTPALP